MHKPRSSTYPRAEPIEIQSVSHRITFLLEVTAGRREGIFRTVRPYAANGSENTAVVIEVQNRSGMERIFPDPGTAAQKYCRLLANNAKVRPPPPPHAFK